MYNTERTSKVKRGILTALMIACLIAIIGGTYARYSSQVAVNATVQVAKWAVAVKSGDTAISSGDNVTFAVQSNQYVVDGKIAPGVTATAEIVLDLTGTEVAVDFDVLIDSGDIANLNSADKISLAVTLDGNTYTSGTSQTIQLPNGEAFTSSNGQKTVLLTLTWTNDDTNNADDTADGIAASTITLPVTFTVQQHIAS